MFEPGQTIHYLVEGFYPLIEARIIRKQKTKSNKLKYRRWAIRNKSGKRSVVPETWIILGEKEYGSDV
jgi:hypothetical protein